MKHINLAPKAWQFTTEPFPRISVRAGIRSESARSAVSACDCWR
jgi:hypothetical protein